MLDFILNRPEGVSSSDAVAMFNSLARNPTANSATFDFLENNWNALQEKYFRDIVLSIQPAHFLIRTISVTQTRWLHSSALFRNDSIPQDSWIKYHKAKFVIEKEILFILIAAIQLRGLLEQHVDTLGSSAIASEAIANVEKNIRWMNTNSATIADWLKEQLVDPWRLPSDIKPITYDIRLLPFIEENNFTTDGQITMKLECLKDTNVIAFNNREINIDSSSIQVNLKATPLNTSSIVKYVMILSWITR